jgi:phosphoribosyl 1,2-cyclic phosphate phosphodiesterase
MSIEVTILGCGSSGGVPRLDGIWGACDPQNPKNRRRRCALLASLQSRSGRTTALVDTPPDLREQLLDVGVGAVDGVLYTHDHADHTHGIDDLRVIAFNRRARVPVFHDEATGEVLKHRFGYCFEMPPGSEYSPFLVAHDITPGEAFTVSGGGGDLPVMPFRQQHGPTLSLGFRFGGVAYSPDVNDLPAESLAHLADLDVWIVDALRPSRHPSHFNLDEALAWIARLKPRRAVLTHMHIDLDYEALRRRLPEGVEPGYDGMVLYTD